jgi:hypothetical protein
MSEVKITLDEQQKMDLLNVLWSAHMWLPTERLQKDAAGLYFEIAEQFGAIDEETKMHFKIKMKL